MLEENKLIIEPYLKSFPNVSLIVSLSTFDIDDTIKFISTNMGLLTIDITDNINYIFLNSLYLQTERIIYLIDLDSLTINKQNSILKFIEECPANAYIILVTTNISQVIQTIITRSVIFELHKYSKIEIANMINLMDLDMKLKDILSNICFTRDDIDNFSKFDLLSLYNLCDKIINNIDSATLPNTLSIKDKYIYFNDYEEDKFSLNVFISMLSYCLLNSFKNTKSEKVYYLYTIVDDFKDKLLNKTFSREFLFDNLLIKLWKISRGELI